MALPFEVTILGVNSAIPVNGRHPSCQIVRYNQVQLMIDCGEGSQSQLARYKIKKDRISHIFISHMHGDHCFGLPGFLTTCSLQRRTNPLTIHGPYGIKKYLDTVLEISGSYITFELEVLEYDTCINNSIPINNNLVVETFPLKHRIPTMGFLVKELKSVLNIIPAKIKEYNLSVDEIKAIKEGEALVRDGIKIPNNQLTFGPVSPRSYAYVSDTKYDPTICSFLEGVSTLYHETTYLDDMKEIAEQRMHTTVGGAVDIARKVGANKLIIGHYSSRYKDLSPFLDQARALWLGVELGEEGRVYTI